MLSQEKQEEIKAILSTLYPDKEVTAKIGMVRCHMCGCIGEDPKITPCPECSCKLDAYHLTGTNKETIVTFDEGYPHDRS